MPTWLGRREGRAGERWGVIRVEVIIGRLGEWEALQDVLLNVGGDLNDVARGAADLVSG
jgi:hypothetical protein